MRSWLKLDAQNRAFRTLLQGVVAVVLVPALVAGLPVLVQAVTDGGGGFDWSRALDTAWKTGLAAAVMSVTAYLHRSKVDPSVVPSAQPPRPPGTSEVQAPATAPAGPLAGR